MELGSHALAADTLKARWVLPTAWGGGHGESECFLRTAQTPTLLS